MCHVRESDAGLTRDWEAAWRWLCQRRRHAPPNADVWDVRFKWPQHHERWLNSVLAGQYRLSPMRVWRRPGNSGVQWSALDALVLKWVTLQVERVLPRHPNCHHLRGHGGVTGQWPW